MFAIILCFRRSSRTQESWLTGKELIFLGQWETRVQKQTAITVPTVIVILMRVTTINLCLRHRQHHRTWYFHLPILSGSLPFLSWHIGSTLLWVLWQFVPLLSAQFIIITGVVVIVLMKLCSLKRSRKRLCGSPLWNTLGSSSTFFFLFGSCFSQQGKNLILYKKKSYIEGNMFVSDNACWNVLILWFNFFLQIFNETQMDFVHNNFIGDFSQVNRQRFTGRQSVSVSPDFVGLVGYS